MVETPVLFETFVRVDYARQVWEAIKAAQPKKLYFYSNKGRAEKDGEIERNNEIRSWVNEINWECDLHTWFREECVDVYTSLRGAISWFFDNEECGIVLEDDCVPSLAFFDYCDQLLPLYKDDMRVWALSGNNFAVQNNSTDCDYFLCRSSIIYGWASWSTRWKSIDWDNIPIDRLIESGAIDQLYPYKDYAKRRKKRLRKIKDFVERTKCWDYVFNIFRDANGSCVIIPSRNLVANIGVDGVHNSSRSFANSEPDLGLDKFEITRKPEFLIPDYNYDVKSYKILYNETSQILIKAVKLKHKIFRLLKLEK